MLDAKDVLRACGGSQATAYRRFAAAVRLAGARATVRRTGGRCATLVPVDAVAAVLGLRDDVVLRLAGVAATDGRVAA